MRRAISFAYYNVGMNLGLVAFHGNVADQRAYASDIGGSDCRIVFVLVFPCREPRAGGIGAFGEESSRPGTLMGIVP